MQGKAAAAWVYERNSKAGRQGQGQVTLDLDQTDFGALEAVRGVLYSTARALGCASRFDTPQPPMSGGSPMNADYNRTTNWGAMGTLAAATLTPLAVASAQTDPAAVAAGVGLAALLIKQTVNTGEETEEVKKSYDKAAEQAALKNVRGTSTMNRCTRIALGATYYYSAITTYARMTSGSSYWPHTPTSAAALVRKGEMMQAGQVLGIEVAKAGAALLLLYIGGIWLSSGWNSQ